MRVGTARLCAFMLGIAVVAMPAASFADPRGGHGHEELGSEVPDVSDGWRGRFAERLGLTPEQREKLKPFREGRLDREKKKLQLQLERLELREMLEKGDASDAQILEKAAALSEKMAESSVSRIKRLLAVRKILTPEQREKFREFIRERAEEKELRGGECSGRGGFFDRKFHRDESGPPRGKEPVKER